MLFVLDFDSEAGLLHWDLFVPAESSGNLDQLKAALLRHLEGE